MQTYEKRTVVKNNMIKLHMHFLTRKETHVWASFKVNLKINANDKVAIKTLSEDGIRYHVEV